MREGEGRIKEEEKKEGGWAPGPAVLDSPERSQLNVVHQCLKWSVPSHTVWRGDTSRS